MHACVWSLLHIDRRKKGTGFGGGRTCGVRVGFGTESNGARSSSRPFACSIHAEFLASSLRSIYTTLALHVDMM